MSPSPLYDGAMRVFSGVQPSGTMHLGNYLGALKQWVEVQSPDAFYCVVDLHALTLQIEPEVLREKVADNVATLVAVGLDPDLCTIFVQSNVPFHAQLTWLLECVASFGELSRMTQFKEKSERTEGLPGRPADLPGTHGRPTSCSTKRPRCPSATTSASTWN